MAQPDDVVIPNIDIAKYLNDENGNVVYPVTKQRFVLDSEGNSLESFVTDIDSRVSELEESQGSGGDTSNCVKVVAQTFSTAQKTQARQNIGAGTSNFSGNYNDLTNKPTIPSITAMSTSEIDTIITNEDSN